MRLQHNLPGGCVRRLGLSLWLLTLLLGLPPRIAAQDKARAAEALAWVEGNAEREELVMVPMRDRVRLSSLLLFPKDRPRRDLPTVLIRHPYLTEGIS